METLEMNSRVEALRALLADQDLDALVISQPENRRYLSGFTGSAGALVISQQDAILATDFRYFIQATQQAPDFELARVTEELPPVLAEVLQRLRARRVGFEATHLAVATHQRWVEAMPEVEWVPTEGLVEGLRAVKDEAELALMRRAVALTDEALVEVADGIRPGMTERQVAWELEVYLRTHGAEGVAFEITVASGPNAALPHARSTDRVIQAGEPVVIDLGARVEGYHADLTRTLCLRPRDGRFEEIYNVVLQAQTAAEAGIRAGMQGEEADSLARQVIEEAGYGDNFGHGLGHGVGLAVHEKPRLGKASEDVLEPGMVVTVEPGIYLPNWGGVRLEDMVLIGTDGVEVLTQAPKRLPAE
jgi:Xaa-Pro aminopeptidase